MADQLGVLDDLWVVLVTHSQGALSALVRTDAKRFASEPGAAELGVPSRGMVAFLLGAGRAGLSLDAYSDRVRRDRDLKQTHRSVERAFLDQAAGTRRFYVADLWAIGESAELPNVETTRLVQRIVAEHPAGESFCFAHLSVEDVVGALRVTRPVYAKSPVSAPPRLVSPQGFSRDRPIFAQFINPEFLQLYSQAHMLLDPMACRHRLERVASMALLASRAGLILPASYLFEVPGVADFVARTDSLAEIGAVQLTAPASGLDEYREAKLAEYRDESANNPYRDTLTTAIRVVQWRPRLGTSAGQSITRAWGHETRRGSALSGVVRSIARFEGVSLGLAARRVAQVPEALEGRALVSKYVLAALPGHLQSADRQAVRWLLSSQYLESYLDDLDAVVLVNFDFGSFSSPGAKDREISAARLRQIFRLLALDLTGPVDQGHWDTILNVRESMELDILVSGLYDEANSREWWRSAATFARKSPAPNVRADIRGYCQWLGDLITRLPD